MSDLSRLADFFPESDIGWLPNGKKEGDRFKGDMALAIPFIDARLVQNRLDSVVGVDGWQEQYELLHDGNSLCRLSVWSEEKKLWVVKCGGGGPAPQMKDANKLKSSFSASLKSAGIKFGIGRYLDGVPLKKYKHDGWKWIDFPRMPPQFLPGGKSAPVTQPSQPAQSSQPTKCNGQQIQEVLLLIGETNSNADQTLKHLKLDAWPNLNTTQHQYIVGKLRERLAAQQEAARLESEMIANADRLAREAAKRG